MGGNIFFQFRKKGREKEIKRKSKRLIILLIIDCSNRKNKPTKTSK